MNAFGNVLNSIFSTKRFSDELLDRFLKDPSTQFTPTTFGHNVVDAIEIKPSVIGLSVDLKKLYKAVFAVFSRWRNKP